MADFTAIYPPPGGSGSGGVTSINGDTTAAQLIVGTGGVTVNTAAGTTTIGLTPGSLSDYLYKPGLSGGQTANGGTDAGDDLLLRSTANASKGDVAIDDGSGLTIGALTTVFDLASNIPIVTVNNTGATSQPLFIGETNDAATAPTIRGMKARGTQAVPTPATAAQTLLSLQGLSYNTASYQVGGTISLRATETWTSTARGTDFRVAVTSTTTNTQQERLLINANATNGQVIMSGTVGSPTNLVWSTDSITGSIGGSSTTLRPGSAHIGTLVTVGNLGQRLGANSVVTTTDATPLANTILQTTTDTYYLLEVKIAAKRTGGASGSPGDYTAIHLQCGVSNNGGTVTLSNIDNVSYPTGSNPYTATLIVSGTNVQAQLTGAATTNVSWQVSSLYTGV